MEKKIIGICIAGMQNDTEIHHVEAICQYAKKKEYYVVVYNSFSGLDRADSFALGEKRVFDEIPMQELSALVVFTETFKDPEAAKEVIKKAKEAKLPVISVDYKIEGCYNMLFAYEETFESIVRHIVEEHKCKTINFMAGFEDNAFSDARIAMCKNVLKQNGLELEEDRLAYGQFWEMPARRACEEWVRKWESGEQKMPDAIICANDIMALTVCSVLTNHGIKIPEEILLTGFDGLELERYCTPRLTTGCTDMHRIGIKFMEMLDACIAGREPYEDKIPFRPVYSESCGCVPVARCNPNDKIMYLYGDAWERRTKSTDTFLMMNALTDGISVKDMAGKLEEYKKIFGIDNAKIFLGHTFYEKTDIDKAEYKEDSMILLSQLTDGNYEVVLKEIQKEQVFDECRKLFQKTAHIIYVPLHWQMENYGYVAVAFEECIKDISGFYEFIFAFQQVLATIRKQSLLHKMYITDSMTGLYNRTGFYSELERKFIELDGREVTLFLASVDMDRLKYINDNYGHAEGDFAIKAVADILRNGIEEHEGICARFGGDEYMAAVLTETQNADANFYEKYEELLQNNIAEYNKKLGKPYTIGASVGVFCAVISGIHELEEYLEKADTAMYRCKSKHHHRMD